MDVETAKQIFSAAKHLEQEGKLEEAIACYRQAIELNPDNYSYHYQLGSLLRQQNRLEQAIGSFRRAIALNNDSWSYHALGEIYNHLQDFATAIGYYQQAIKLNPDFSWSYYNLARIFHQQKQLKLAQNYYQQAIELDRDFFWSHYFLAEILANSDRTQAAIVCYREVIRLKPQFYDAYYALARCLQKQGELEQAVQYYYRAIEIDAGNYHCYYYLGKSLIGLNRFSEAISCYEKSAALQPNNLQAFFCIGKVLIERGRKRTAPSEVSSDIGTEQAAIANYRNLARQKSLRFQVHLELGLAQAWQKIGNPTNSIDCCQRAITIDPTAKLPYLIFQYIPIGNELDRVIDFYQQIARLERVNPLLWGNLGDLLSKQSRIPEAIDCYRTSCYKNSIIKNPNLANFNWLDARKDAPDFIIIGATKCGTTSLFSYLNNHPQVLAPHKKEINFFNHNFQLGTPWYLAHFPAIADFSDYITGEASPFYIYDTQVVERISKLFPNIKLIAMLRNPVERTISEYYHAVNHGLETRSLSEIIELEKKRLVVESRSKAMQHFGYLLNSIYVEKIVPWKNNFTAENFLIIQSESFFENTERVMQQVGEFLNISYQTSERHIRYNVGNYSPVTSQIRRKLEEFFVPFNRELEDYLGRKFDW